MAEDTTAATAAAAAAATVASITAAEALKVVAAEAATALKRIADDTRAASVALVARDSTQEALLARMVERTENTQRDVAEIKTMLNSKYVTEAEFKPVRVLVYGLAGAMLLGIIGAVGKLLVP